MIDVIIPAFNAHKTIVKTIESIEIQTFKDKINVLIVDDCSQENYNYLIDKFKNTLNINILRLEKNVGSGLSRQYGIDKTSGKYIIFIDADDLLKDRHSIEKLYNKIEEGYDTVMSKTYDEYYDIDVFNENDLHGKIYRRNFLQNNNIKFNETRFHEDNLFNNLVLILGAKVGKLEDIIYIYCNNENSITRNTFEQEFNRLEIFLYNINCINNFIRDKKYDKNIYIDLLYSKYFFLNKFYFKVNKDGKNRLKEWVKKYDKNNIDLIGILDADDLFEQFVTKKRVV